MCADTCVLDRHLGSFYNDSEALGGLTSSPVTHGFDHFNATVEVAPTATTNCNCRKDWSADCLYGTEPTYIRVCLS